MPYLLFDEITGPHAEGNVSPGGSRESRGSGQEKESEVEKLSKPRDVTWTKNLVVAWDSAVVAPHHHAVCVAVALVIAHQTPDWWTQVADLIGDLVSLGQRYAEGFSNLY
jgi:hypothetical protein